MQEKIRDVIIVWWGAAGLFCSIFADKKLDKLILENSKRVWSKILLSWWWRCNVTNINLNPESDYVWDNLKALPSIFHKFDNNDTINRFSEKWLAMHEEKYGKMYLDCEKSSKLVELLVKESRENNSQILFEQWVIDINKKDDTFFVKTKTDEYISKNIVIASGGINFPQIWATWIAWDIAKKFWIEYVDPYPCLSWVEIQEDVSTLTWNAVEVEVKVSLLKKVLFENKWSMLFTHRWFSWPAVFDIGLFVWRELTNYRLKDYKLLVKFDVEKLNEKTIKFFWLSEQDCERKFSMTGFRPWELAKATWWWIKLSQLDNNLQSKKISWLYFVGEACDITGRTWGFNLQWAWSSGYVTGKSL